jgi:hypothetical protein
MRYDFWKTTQNLQLCTQMEYNVGPLVIGTRCVLQPYVEQQQGGWRRGIAARCWGRGRASTEGRRAREGNRGAGHRNCSLRLHLGRSSREEDGEAPWEERKLPARWTEKQGEQPWGSSAVCQGIDRRDGVGRKRWRWLVGRGGLPPLKGRSLQPLVGMGGCCRAPVCTETKKSTHWTDVLAFFVWIRTRITAENMFLDVYSTMFVQNLRWFGHWLESYRPMKIGLWVAQKSVETCENWVSNHVKRNWMNAIFWYDVPPLVTNNFYIWWTSSCSTNFREHETSTRMTLISNLEEFESWNQIFILSWGHCLRYLEIESRLGLNIKFVV